MRCDEVQQVADVFVTARCRESRHGVREPGRIPLAGVQQSPLFSAAIAHREGEGKSIAVSCLLWFCNVLVVGGGGNRLLKNAVTMHHHRQVLQRTRKERKREREKRGR